MSVIIDDEDDEVYEGLYENGHWEWDETYEKLQFVSQAPDRQESFFVPEAAIVGPFAFNDDVDILEQNRFKKRFQRKPSPDLQFDVVTIQDIKDIVLFTAPKQVLTANIIKILHLPRTERFLRALVLYCQYFLQISDTMTRRGLELETKIYTQNSTVVESAYRENLEDLRVLIAKEYYSMILGEDDYKAFHHMGSMKERRSLTNKDANLNETLLRFSVQIVYIALGRKHYAEIDSEINRLFKSNVYNFAKLNRNKSIGIEQDVMSGRCQKKESKLKQRSPMIQQLHCRRSTDYRMFGLAMVKYPCLNARLLFFERAISAREDFLKDFGIPLGILGLLRSRFDIMLRPINFVPHQHTSASAVLTTIRRLASLKGSLSSARSRTSASKFKLFPDLVLPAISNETEPFPEQFPTSLLPIRPCSKEQRQRWLNKAARIFAANAEKLPKIREKTIE